MLKLEQSNNGRLLAVHVQQASLLFSKWKILNNILLKGTLRPFPLGRGVIHLFTC